MDFTHGHVFKGLCERESHTTADDEGVDLVEHVFDELDLVRHLGTAEDSKEGAIGALKDFCKVLEFFLHEETGGLFLEVDANHTSVSTVCGAKSIVDVEIAECGELLLEIVYDVLWDLYLVWAFTLFGAMEAEILEEDDGAVRCVIDGFLDIGTYAIVEEDDGFLELFREYGGDRFEGVFQGAFAIWAPEVGHEHDGLGVCDQMSGGMGEGRRMGILLSRIKLMVGMAATMRCGPMIQGWGRVWRSGTHGRVCDNATVCGIVLHGDVEVDADEDAASWDGIGESGVVDEELV